MQKYGRQYPDGMVMVDVPLLIEANLLSWFDQIILVYVPVAVQLERKYADFVIDNSGSLAASRTQVEKIFHCLQTVH